jgi:hypothetical protein
MLAEVKSVTKGATFVASVILPLLIFSVPSRWQGCCRVAHRSKIHADIFSSSRFAVALNLLQRTPLLFMRLVLNAHHAPAVHGPHRSATRVIRALDLAIQIPGVLKLAEPLVVFGGEPERRDRL